MLEGGVWCGSVQCCMIVWCSVVAAISVVDVG